ncbi:hypothetical protein CPB84DRAFT_1801850 [Gymnopilus junonius]|uniref:Uncharacterized protein n=1 Tax=Gymnopilus junonius TaxID=109634 RepID=A0A9P5N8D1_GYMJU|nr:hypothetical protein CPB84DRAFT_1801850 [Gymnopilus junonius]
MNDSLKDAASLIAAYRKQSRVVRRLSLSNSDKFVSCAQNINTCCSDFLMSLQIHQTIQLDILKRAVPVDEEDKAAQNFVRSHGGSVDALVQNRELLQGNLTQSMRQISVRLDSILLANVSSAFSTGLKNLALELYVLEAEQKFRCIQCDKDPSSQHHCDYPYGSFFIHASKARTHGNVEEWASVKDADVGQLLRWVWRGSPIEENTLLWDNWDTLEAKAATSIDPWICICPIDVSTCTKSGTTLVISEGGLRSYKPVSPYILPEDVRFGPVIDNTQTRRVRTDFKSRTAPALHVILRSMSDPPLSANTNITDTFCDYFTGKVAIYNNNTTASMDSVTIASVSALYRMVGDPEYVPVHSFQLLSSPDILPFTIAPRQSFLLNFQATVLRTEGDTKLSKRWSNRAFLARHRPIRIKLVVEDMEGNECSLVMEYVMQPQALESRKETDVAFMFVDDPQTYSRFYVRVKKPAVGSKDDVLEIITERRSSFITKTKLKQVVYRALKTNESEVDLGIGSEEDRWAWNIWALVDLSCRRIYAFKLTITEGKNFPIKHIGTLGYFHCPDYGDISEEIRPISYATEKAKLLSMEPYPQSEYAQDDDFDDMKAPVPSTTADSSAINTGVSLAIPVELTNRLTSIDKNLGRLADSFEKLLTMLPHLSNNGHVDKV